MFGYSQRQFYQQPLLSHFRHTLRAYPEASNVVLERASGLPGLWALLSAARSEGSSVVWQAFSASINVLASVITSSKNTGLLTATTVM